MKLDSATKEQKELYNRWLPKIRRFWRTLAPDLYTWVGWAAILGGLDYVRVKAGSPHAGGILTIEIILWVATWGYFMARLTANQPATWQDHIPAWKPVASLIGAVSIMAIGWWLGSVFAAIEAAAKT